MATDLVQAVSRSLQRTADSEEKTQQAEQQTPEQCENESDDNTRAPSIAISRVASQKDSDAPHAVAAATDVEKDSGKKIQDQPGVTKKDLLEAMLPVG
jgi:hypothetical protein